MSFYFHLTVIASVIAKYHNHSHLEVTSYDIRKSDNSLSYNVTKLMHGRLITYVIPLIVSLQGIVSLFASSEAVFINFLST